MPYVNKPRPYKKEYQQQLARNEGTSRLERQRAREQFDQRNPDSDGNGTADSREGKDIAHKKALSRGGSNKDGYTVQSKTNNRSFKRNSNHQLVSETSKREGKR